MLSPEQITAVKAAIVLDPAMASVTQTPSGPETIAKLFNAPDAAYFVYRKTADVEEVYDAILWANLTPADTPDGTGLCTNRALVCQAKQLNLQILLQGRSTINSSKASIRAGLEDALKLIPSGPSGATQAAGWPAVKTVLTRNATRLEKLLTSGAGTAAAPANLVYAGIIGVQEMSDIIGTQ